MKLLITIIILLQFTDDSIAKYTNNRQIVLNGSWVGPGGEYMDITNDSAFFASASISSYGNKYVSRFKDNILSFRTSDEDSFRVVRLTKDTLVLTAANDNAFQLIKTHEPVVFVNRNILNAPSFSFGKICFSRSGSGMMVADYSNVEFEIDSSGSMQFSCVRGKGKYNGTYKGQLSIGQLDKLNELVKRSEPDRFVIPREHWEDAPGYSFKFYYNNKVREAYGQGIPYLARDLVDFIYTLSYNIQLEKISDKFGIGR